MQQIYYISMFAVWGLKVFEGFDVAGKGNLDRRVVLVMDKRVIKICSVNTDGIGLEEIKA